MRQDNEAGQPAGTSQGEKLKRIQEAYVGHVVFVLPILGITVDVDPTFLLSSRLRAFKMFILQLLRCAYFCPKKICTA